MKQPLPAGDAVSPVSRRLIICFNVYNQTNFIFPVSSLSTEAFGRYVSNSTASRILQFVAKVKF